MNTVKATQIQPPQSIQPAVGNKIQLSGIQVKAALTEVQTRWDHSTQKTYQTAAAKALSLQGTASVAGGTEHGTEWGTLIHLLLETAMARPTADLKALAATTLAELGLSPSLVDPALAMVQKVTASSIWARARKSSHCLVEVPFELAMPAGADGLTTILRGVVDLAFLEAKGWVIVDYKTDRHDEQDLPKLVEKYRPQIQTYAQVWNKTLGLPVQESGLYFTNFDKYVPC